MSHRERSRRAALGAVAALVAGGLCAIAQEPARPTAEHATLALSEGTWDASVQISMGAPGTPPQVSKGVETNHMCCGGLWMISEFKSDPGSAPFEGYGMTGYEPSKKKYITTWVDSDLTMPMISEGIYDAKTRTLTLRGSMTAQGKTLQWRNVEVWKDDDTRQYTMYQRGPDGKESPSLSITYTRRK